MLKQRLVAHRGYQRKYPENTLLAMTEAVRAGALFLETDIQFTKDNYPVLIHDTHLARISGKDKLVEELLLSEIKGIPANEPFRLQSRYIEEKVSSLASYVSFLEKHPKVTAFIEMKEESINRLGFETVYNSLAGTLNPVLQQTIIISFDIDFIAYCRNRGFPKVGIVLNEWAELGGTTVQKIQPDYVFSNINLIPKKADLNKIDPILVIYEIDSPQEAIQLFERGADMVETFDIGGMLETMSTHAI